MRRRTYLRTSAGAIVGLGATGGLGSAGTDGERRAGSRGGTGQPRRVVAGTAPGFPPFEFREQGELVGFDVDLLEAVLAETEGYELARWRTFEFSTLIPALTSGNIDVIAAAMTITDERDETIDFTDPYYSADQSVLVREDGEFQPSSLADLAGRPVGAQTGTTGEGEVQKLIENGTVEQANYNGYGNYVLAVEDLVNGNVDAVVLDRPVAETFADQRPVEVAFTVETGERYGFGVRENDDDLTAALNEGLAAVEESSQLEEITARWFGEEAEDGAANETAANETGPVVGNETAGNETAAPADNATGGNATGGNATGARRRPGGR